MPTVQQVILPLALICAATPLAASPGEPLLSQAMRNLAVHAPEDQESQLRFLLAEHPSDGVLFFRLGNLLASQQRWSAARQAYARAAQLTSGHPDIHYNLAVSLEHLEQPEQAAQHYQAALHAAQNRAHQFQPATVQQRLWRIVAGQS